MGAKAGFALKLVQWFFRGIQFCCSALILAIFSYFLATLSNRGLTIPTWTRAVEGISGIGVLYTIVGLLLLCCLAGHPFTSFIAIVLDICFIGAYIYVASSTRAGASSCTGTVDTVFGSGQAESLINDKHPTYREACQMETACLAVSIVAILFFVFSAALEVVLVRHRRKEQRFGPSPANNYTSGYAKRRGLLGLFRKKRTADAEDPNVLPAHTQPDQMRQSYNTEATAVGPETGTYNNKYQYDGQVAYPETGTATTHTTPAGYRY
ncbi:uncharacterized protein GGS22DRAFT_173142 [Annulohypoxylon maeteangense]|uniref:uncharacterized protein n=1 Tax=Annulohypoxylon maeteangense TaxID=1927788 RepID=UPI00200733C7|nr:uncharacterized protein GGS22DRAFT_173142 [Annulohypoxylon maeteangense]KAI0881022.1 hypothetical protein GGS22DRAFT_173142 [Annulohypoxylon maeteangense]